MDPSSHKEFRISNDGRFVAVGTYEREVCVIRVEDQSRRDLADVSYDFGGQRLAVDGASGKLFSGAYHFTGIAAYDIETGLQLWSRRDLKKLQKIAHDPHRGLVYCAFEGRATRPLNERDGREKNPVRGLKDFYFSRNGELAVFEFDNVRLENRTTGVTHELPKENWGLLGVAFTPEAVVLSWGGGPVASYRVASGEFLWKYVPEGTHAYDIAPAADESSVWIVEQPYNEPPWQRLRRIGSSGNVEREIRCALGHSFRILPYCDKVIRADLRIVTMDEIAAER